MLRIQSFTFNPFSENTYLVINDRKEAWIIDPGMYDENEYKELTNYIETEHLLPVKIVNTHAHIDHVFGVQALKNRYHIPFGIHQEEQTILQSATVSALMFGMEFNEIPEVDFFIAEKEKMVFGDNTFTVLWTPGHSPGSVSFYEPNEHLVLSGDVLFQNSIGRTDLPGGNQQQLFDSIRQKLFTLPEDTKVYPGHGPSTTIGMEMKNGFMARVSDKG